MEQLLSELRALRAKTGTRQVAIAERMGDGMNEKILSTILTGERKTLPENFEARFRAAVAELAAEEAQRERAEAEARARAIEAAAGIAPALAA